MQCWHCGTQCSARPRLDRPVSDAARAWAALAAGLSLLAVLARWLPPGAIDWQPALAAHEPWRAWSAAALHYSPLHLAANLAGAALVGAFGVVAQVPLRCALAWLVAWPLTQFGLAVEPALAHFGGLSGVLHAGVAIVALHLIVTATGRRRLIGSATLALLCLKVLSESPWGAPLRHPAGWDIAVAPLAHASGLVSGLLCGAVGERIVRRRDGR